MSKHLYDKLNRFFRLEESGTTVRTEVLAGATSFIAVAYILILSHPYEIMGETDMAVRISNGVFIDTASPQAGARVLRVSRPPCCSLHPSFSRRLLASSPALLRLPH